ncbi:ribbon-helix-helix protein, CopG family [Anaerotignum sp.]
MENKKLIVKPKKPRGEDGHKVFSIRIKDEIVTQLEEICAKTGYSRNELIGLLLEYALENCEVEDAEANE